MKLAIALERLRAAKTAVQALGAVHLYLFGSTSRQEAREDSDVDIFIDRDPAMPFGLLELGRMETALERLVGAEVDLTTRDGLHPEIREHVETNAIQVF